MQSENRKNKLIGVVCFCFFALTVAGNCYPGGVAAFNFTETEIVIIPNAQLLNVSVQIFSPTGDIVYQRQEIAGSETIRLSEFNSTEDGNYRLTLSGDTGETIENTGRSEDGRENKTYVLKKIVEETSNFTLSGAKILSADIIED